VLVRPLLFDSSVLIPMIRVGIYRRSFSASAASVGPLSQWSCRSFMPGHDTSRQKRLRWINRAFLIEGTW